MMVCVKISLRRYPPALAPALLAQQSQWVHPGANGHLVYSRDKSGVMIPDYSFAGYHSGGVALPTVPAQIKLSPTGATTLPPFSTPSIPSLPVRSTPRAPAVPYNSPRRISLLCCAR